MQQVSEDAIDRLRLVGRWQVLRPLGGEQPDQVVQRAPIGERLVQQIGSAEVFIDGASRGTVNYKGASGGLKDPVFGAKVEYGNLAPGQHTIQFKNMSEGVYIDRFCLED